MDTYSTIIEILSTQKYWIYNIPYGLKVISLRAKTNISYGHIYCWIFSCIWWHQLSWQAWFNLIYIFSRINQTNSYHQWNFPFNRLDIYGSNGEFIIFHNNKTTDYFTFSPVNINHNGNNVSNAIFLCSYLRSMSLYLWKNVHFLELLWLWSIQDHIRFCHTIAQ